MPIGDFMDKLKEYELGFELGPFKYTSKWVPDEAEQMASWEMYVELITRVAVQEPMECARRITARAREKGERVRARKINMNSSQ